MSDPVPARPRPPSIWLLFAMIYAGQLASMIYLPGLPDIARDLETTTAAAQSLVGTYLVAFAFVQLVMGPLSDRFGRRPVIMGGLILFTVASAVCALVPDIGALLAMRVIQAAGACATIVVGRAMIRDTSEGVEAARAMSWFASAMALGPSTAPLLGGFLTGWFGWQSTFIATAVISAGVLVFVLIELEETLPPDQRERPRIAQLAANYVRLLGNPTLVGYSAIVAMTSGAIHAYLTAAPIVFVVLMGVSPELLGLYIVLMPMVYLVATQIARSLTYRLPINRIILIGVACSASGGLAQFLVGLAAVTTPYPVLAAFALSNFGTGLLFANCYAQALSAVAPPVAGQASAIAGFIQMGWGAIVAFGVANMIHTSSLQLGIAQMTTTWLGATVAIIVILVARPAHRGR